MLALQRAPRVVKQPQTREQTELFEIRSAISHGSNGETPTNRSTTEDSPEALQAHTRFCGTDQNTSRGTVGPGLSGSSFASLSIGIPPPPGPGP